MPRVDEDAKYEREADEAAESAKAMERDDLEAHYVSAIVNWQIVLDDRDKAEAALAETQRLLDAYRDVEANCCPEDVGFPEYIGSLIRQLAATKRRLTEAETLLREMLAEFPDADVIAALEPVTNDATWQGRLYQTEPIRSKRIVKWRAFLAAQGEHEDNMPRCGQTRKPKKDKQ